VRTAAITREFLDEDHIVTYATTTPETAKEVCPEEVEVTPLDSRSNTSTFLEWIQANQPDAVLIDAYSADTEYQRRIREHVPLAVYIDDVRYPICADILINGNLYASELRYDFVGNPPKQLLGPDFVPLREEVRLLADQDPPWRDSPRRALITMGGVTYRIELQQLSDHSKNSICTWTRLLDLGFLNNKNAPFVPPPKLRLPVYQ
jgi:UDP-2,4-diacetamido-2,4,6-trideoxy-beta-L-altropyranose hydrolase